MAEQTFDLDVPDIGTFTFRRRTARLAFAAVKAGIDFIGGAATTGWQADMGTAIGVLATFTVRSPDGWNLENMDPLDPDDAARILAVAEALRAEEARFRGRA